MRSWGNLNTAGVLRWSAGYGTANARRGRSASIARLVLHHALLGGLALGIVIASVLTIAWLGIAFTVSGIPVR